MDLDSEKKLKMLRNFETQLNTRTPLLYGVVESCRSAPHYKLTIAYIVKPKLKTDFNPTPNDLPSKPCKNHLNSMLHMNPTRGKLQVAKCENYLKHSNLIFLPWMHQMVERDKLDLHYHIF